MYDFRNYLKSKGYGTGTIRNYTYQVRIFIYSNDLPLDQLTDKEIGEHRDKLKEEGKISNANHFMCGAKIFFWLWKRKILDVHVREFHRKERKKKIRFITRKELVAICGYMVEVGVN